MLYPCPSRNILLHGAGYNFVKVMFTQISIDTESMLIGVLTAEIINK
jgi:hypothetical protein